METPSREPLKASRKGTPIDRLPKSKPDLDSSEVLGLQVIGYLKGKSAIHIAREFAGRKRNFVGQHFWARGYFVSTVGRDEAVIREYIREHEREDQRQDQLGLQM